MNYPQYFLRMSERTLRETLARRRRRLPPPLVESIVDGVKTAKAALRPVQKKREQHTRLWRQLIDPAASELRNVQRMLRLALTHPTPERTAALEAYAKVLETLIGKFRLHLDKLHVSDDYIDDSLLTPSQHASKPTHAFPQGKPNKGEHWVDWVPPDVVHKIYALFATIPKERHVKRKEPFPVTLDRADSAKRKAVLIERTTKEMEHVERLIAAELADTRLTDKHVFKQQEINSMRQQVSRMQEALQVIAALPPNAFVPPTWHGVMTPRTAPGQPPAVKPKKENP